MQGPHPMVLFLSRGGFCPKDRRQAEGLVHSNRELEYPMPHRHPSATDNITERMTIAVASTPTAISLRRRPHRQKDSTSPNTGSSPQSHDPHVIVLEPGLVVYKIYTALVLGRPPTPTVEALSQDLRAGNKKCAHDLGHHHPELKARPPHPPPPPQWQQAAKTSLPVRPKPTSNIGEQD